MDLDIFDKIIVSYSGGKDSTACVLYLLDQGANPAKMELWHQCIDGKGDTHKEFFDWPSTEGYTREFAKMFGIKLGWQWRDKGFYGEMHRENALTGDVYYQYEGEEAHCLPTTRGKPTTRKKFPAKSGDLKVRWCSAYLKIDPAARALSNIAYLKGTIDEPLKVLFVTGERRQESKGRSKYKEVEVHRCHSKSRNVTQWRCVIDMSEAEVWSLMEKYKIQPHPAYYLGFPRLSCRSCIFFSKNHWATLKEISPKAIKLIQETEEEFGFTLDNKLSIQEMVSMGNSLIKPEERFWIPMAVREWTGSLKMENWRIPAGAFGKGGGAI